MMCENEYQSESCWEFSELKTTPCQSFTKPHLQMRGWPITSRTIAKSARIPMLMKKYVFQDSCILYVLLNVEYGDSRWAMTMVAM